MKIQMKTEFEKELRELRENGLKSNPLRLEYEILRERKTADQIIESFTRPIQNLDSRLTIDGFIQWYEEIYSGETE